MDLTPRKGAPTTTTTTATQSHESDSETEIPLQTHLSKALYLTNGSFNPCHHHHHQPPPPPMVVFYKECLKNHAASLGGLSLDGCGEFMPASTSNPLDPTSLKCAACGCHRNFHRREHLPPPHGLPQWASSPSPSSDPSPSSPAASPTPQHSIFPSTPHMLLALSTGGHFRPLDENHHGRSSSSPTVINPLARKRSRTKLSGEQKKKMLAFAEKLGWRMLRGLDEDKMVEEFCSEVGVKRKVFKVWMHNNKHRREKGAKFDVNGIAYNKADSDCFESFQIESKVHVQGSRQVSSPSS